MLVIDVLKKFNKLVPFPLTLKKIADAGFDAKQYFKDMGDELRQCEDVGNHPQAKEACKLLGCEAPTGKE